MYEKISQAMTERGYSRDAMQCRVKIKELRQAYQKTKESNGRSGSQPHTCRFYEALHAMLGGAATTTPPVSVDSDDGVLSTATSSEVFADGEDEEGEKEDEAVDSAFNTDFPDSQDLFITLTEIPYEPSQGSNPDQEPGEGSEAVSVSRPTHGSPSQRLAQIRRRKKRTWDDMFSELMVCSRNEAAQWREDISRSERTFSERERRAEAHEDRWWQEDQQATQTLLGLMREQMDTLWRLVDVLQDWRQEERAPLAGAGPTPEDEVIDEKMELDDVEPTAGSPSRVSSQELFFTLEVSSQSRQLHSGKQEAGEEIPGVDTFRRGYSQLPNSTNLLLQTLENLEHEARRYFLCKKCKLVAMLEETIFGLQVQVEMKLRTREAEEVLDSHVQKTPVSQVKGSLELATKELEIEEVREDSPEASDIDGPGSIGDDSHQHSNTASWDISQKTDYFKELGSMLKKKIQAIFSEILPVP
ncbi:uncharacterized protein RBU57_000460 [Macrochelys suwanniensis]